MSKLAGKDGPHGRSNALAPPVKSATTERALLTSANMCPAEDNRDGAHDELSEQIANSRCRVSVMHLSRVLETICSGKAKHCTHT